MIDLTTLDRNTTPETFFLEILPEVLGEVDIPDNLGTERLQITITGDEGIELHIGIDEDGDLTIEEGQSQAPPIAITSTSDDFCAMIAGDLRDKLRQVAGDINIEPKHLKRLFLPSHVIEKVKALSGNIQTCIQDKDEGLTYTVTTTIGGGAPNLTNPECKVTIDVATLIDVASGKEQMQQLFFQGRIRVDGDMAVVLGLMGAVTAPA